MGWHFNMLNREFLIARRFSANSKAVGYTEPKDSHSYLMTTCSNCHWQFTQMVLGEGFEPPKA